MAEREAGAIVIRAGAAGTEVLLVTASGDPNVWLFPKGHIEPGESAGDAARREAAEEAGVLGTVIGPVGTTAYEHLGRAIEVEYFLLVPERMRPPAEHRQVVWLSSDEALLRLTFENARDMLLRAMLLGSGEATR